jgi:TonB-dependent receptor
MKLFTFLLLLASLLVISNNSIVKAQEGSGKIQGTVTDASTGEALFGANVILEQTSYGAATDIDGIYHITNISPGTYQVSFTYIGYKSYIVTEKVSAGKTLTLNVRLTLEAIEGQTVTVTAQKQGQIAAINQQLSSNSIQDVVAKDWIQEVPDVNAAESIGRLPGVSLERSGGEGNKIIIDGLAPKYNNIEVDGVQLNGTDLDRSAGLSIIQDQMLEGIVLSKSLTPDMDADAIGGVVNLTLKEAEPGYHFTTLAQGTYNNYTNSYGNYQFYVGIGDRFLDNSLGIIGNFGTSKIDRSDNSFGAGYGSIIPKNEPAEVTTNNANLTQNLDQRYRSFGDIVLDYQTKFIKLKLDNTLSQQIDPTQNRQNNFNFTSSDFEIQMYESKPINTIRTHSLSSIFSFLNTELKLEASYSRTTTSNFQEQYHFVDQNLIPSTIAPAAMIYTQPSSLINQYYNITYPKTSVLYQSYLINTAEKDETYTYKGDWKIPYSITKEISGNVRVGGFYSDKDRNNGENQEEAEYYAGRGEQFVATLQSAGVFPDKEFPNFIYNKQANINNANGMPAVNWVVPNYDWGSVVGGYHLGYSENFGTLNEFTRLMLNYSPNWLFPDGQQNFENSYTNNEKKAAAYIMTEIHIGENLMLLPGVRYEDFHSVYNSYFIQVEGESPTGIKYTSPVSSVNGSNNWFPSVNAKYSINDWSDIRAAYFASCTRPDYSLLSPGATLDEGQQNLAVYNPFLKPATANNYDLIYSFHSNEVGLLSIDGFYKEITGLIMQLPAYEPKYYNEVIGAPGSVIAELEAPRVLYDPTIFQNTSVLVGNYNGGFPINNPDKTYFRGLELNWETNFWYLPGFLSNLILDVNYTQIWSSTENPYLNIVNGFKPGVIPIPISTPYYTTTQSRMQSQPANIWNIRVGWDYKGFSTRLSFRYQGPTLNSLDVVNGITDSYSIAQFDVDWSMTQKLFNNLTFMADVTNINQYVDESDIKTGNYTFPQSMEAYGIVADIGFRYELK